MQASNTLRSTRAWVSGVLFFLTALLWLGVSSNRNNILHAIGKLGVAAKGYGTVNLPLLLVRFCWSVEVFFLVAMVFKPDIKKQTMIYMLIGFLVLTTTMAALGIFLDEWFSVSPGSALTAEILEFALAGALAWLFLFRRTQQHGLSTLIGSGLLGLSGLILLTSVGLLICPNVSFRF